MVYKRIIPCLDVDNGRVVKGTNFIDIKDAGDPVALAKKYANDGADELVFLDITASSNKRAIVKDLVQAVAKEIFIPFTVGGGIDSLEAIQEILNLGADKVSLNTAAIKNPTLIRDASQHFGRQCIVVALDIKKIIPTAVKKPKYSHLMNHAMSASSTHTVFTHGGREDIGIDAIQWAKYCESLGAGELLITSMNKDGTNDGYDIDSLRAIKQTVSIPVIASGGAGTINHIQEALTVTDAALLASILHYDKVSLPQIKAKLVQANYQIRL